MLSALSHSDGVFVCASSTGVANSVNAAKAPPAYAGLHESKAVPAIDKMLLQRLAGLNNRKKT